MSRESLTFFVVTVVLCSVDAKQPELLKPTGNVSDSARFVPPPPPLFPAILFPVNAATGILVAIAIPVPLPDQSVFVSYNFEANYNMPNIPADSIPGPLIRFKLNNPYPAVDPAADASYNDVIARKIIGDTDFDDTTTEYPEETLELEKRSVNEDRMVFTRRGAYRLIESRLNASGIRGKTCLLLAICETAKFPFLESNGVIGHVLHVILTPSSSMNENLPTEYTKAETLGTSGDCRKYEKNCNFNVLETFSKIL